MQPAQAGKRVMMKSYCRAAVLAASVSLDAAAAEEKRYFKIEEQPVNSALLEFAL